MSIPHFPNMSHYECPLNVLRSETREKINRQYTYIVENIKFIYTSFDEFFLPIS
jgi:hypothetical protein